MLDGDFRNPTTILFGGRGISRMAARLAGNTSSVLIVHGVRSYRDSGLAHQVGRALHEKGIAFEELGGVLPNPKADLVYSGIARCRAFKPDVILAVGGASVIDTAKAIGIGSCGGSDVAKYFLGTDRPLSSLPVAVVLTIFGAGSESNDGAVIDFGGRKYSCSHPVMSPIFSVLDPELTQSVSPFLLGSGVFDAFSHVVERYFTATDNVSTSTELCLGLMRALASGGPELVRNPANAGLRADLMWAAKLAHDNTVGFGRKQDWATHAIAHEVGARSDWPHGSILSVVLPAWVEHIGDMFPALVARLGEFVFGCCEPDARKAVTRTISCVRRLASSLGLPSTIEDLGIATNQELREIAAACCTINPSGTIGNLKRLDEAAILDVLVRASRRNVNATNS